MIEEKLGGRIRKAREAQGLTQAELAQRVGSKSGRAATVSEWESDRGGLDAATLIEIRQVLDVDGHWLLTGEGEMRPADPDQAVKDLAQIKRILREGS